MRELYRLIFGFACWPRRRLHETHWRLQSFKTWVFPRNRRQPKADAMRLLQFRTCGCGSSSVDGRSSTMRLHAPVGVMLSLCCVQSLVVSKSRAASGRPRRGPPPAAMRGDPLHLPSQVPAPPPEAADWWTA